MLKRDINTQTLLSSTVLSVYSVFIWMSMVIKYICKGMCIYKLVLQVQRKYMGYIVIYYIQKFLIYTAMQVQVQARVQKVYKHA